MKSKIEKLFKGKQTQIKKGFESTFILSLLGIALLPACASTPNTSQLQRAVIDNSARGGEMPRWIGESKVSWEEDNRIYFKALFSVKGSQRLNGCFDLVRLEQSETVLENIKHEIKGEIALANEGIAEEADPLITKSISKSFNGTIKGLRAVEQAYERYLVNNAERIDCYLLSSMSKQDYNALKNNAFEQLISVNDEVARVVRKRQSDFFKSDKDKAAHEPARSEASEKPEDKSGSLPQKDLNSDHGA